MRSCNNTKVCAWFLANGWLATSFIVVPAAKATDKPEAIRPAWSEINLKDPETEIASALTVLENLASRVETAAQSSVRQGLGPQNMAAQSAFEHALTYFSHKEWLSVIRELNVYLNLTQVPVSDDYLKAQWMLARAHEEVGNHSRALKAYSRYLATFLTAEQKDEEQFVEVVRRVIALSDRERMGNQSTRDFLASLTSFKIPDDVRQEIWLVAAKTAARSGDTNLAETWIKKVLDEGDSGLLKAKAHYLRALMSIKAKDYPTAEAALAEAIEEDDGKVGLDGLSIKDLSRLALGRIASMKGRHETALRYYAGVGADSPAFREALFESAHVYLARGEDQEARAKALLFLARFPEAPEGLKLRSMLAYLDLRAGDLPAAEASIKLSDQNLDKVSTWMQTNFSGITAVDRARLTEFVALSAKSLQNSPLIDEAEDLFMRLAESSRRLADIDGEIRDMVYTLGRANIENLKPAWVNRSEQLAKLSDEVLSVGHRLAASERNLLKSKITEVEQQQLKASEARRMAMLTPAAEAKRNVHDWRRMALIFEYTGRIDKSHQRLAHLGAQLTATRNLLSKSKNQAQKVARENRLRELSAQVENGRRQVAETLVRVRRAKVEMLAARSPHIAAQKFLVQYATALHEESFVLKRARLQLHSASDKLVARESLEAWRRFQFVVDRLLAAFETLGRDVESGVHGTLQIIAAHAERHRELEFALADVRAQLERRLGANLARITDRYNHSIMEQRSRHQKWRADIEWLRFAKNDAEQMAADKRHELEKQILKDNLTDLQQGVLWKWPE